MLRLYNTLTKRKNIFKPIEKGKVGMYNCGPTVYDFVHIGNLRAYIFTDILRRTLEWNGYSVRQVMNITDFGHLTSDADTGEDKMMKGLKREGKPITLESMHELAGRYMEAFVEDLKALNIQSPTSLPRASDHVPEQIDIIKGLEEKGFTYRTSDGVYFDTSKDKKYGKLGGLPKLDKEYARVAENSEKKNTRDFALWKLNDNLGWNSPWGKGFPGWHLECSAMSMKYLGNHFDIHTGGKEHIAVHHNNEIAQSENFTGETFANYWLHNEWIQLSGEKMAKSSGGFITRRDLEEKGFNPISYRYWVLTAHYRTPADFSWKALENAESALEKLYARMRGFKTHAGDLNKKYIKNFTEVLNDDLNTPEAIAVMWNLLKDKKVSDEDKKSTLLAFDKVLGLGLSSLRPAKITDKVQKLIDERELARKKENWKEADKLRKDIEKNGFRVKDSDSGPVVDKI